MLDTCVLADPEATAASAKQIIQMITYLNHATHPAIQFCPHNQIFADEKQMFNRAGSARFSG